MKTLFGICTAAISADNDEIHLFPAGEFRAADGRPADAPCWRMDEGSAQRLISALSKRQTQLMVDYEHQTLYTNKNGKPNPAAGWITALRWDEGKGLFATVRWTAAARERIKAGEYRYISPMFQYLPDGSIVSLLPAALTNTPALDNLAEVQLAAASLFNSSQSTQEEKVDKNLIALWALLGVDKPTPEQDLAAAVAALKAQLGERTLTAALSANPDASAYVPVAVMTELKAEVAALTAKLADKEAGERTALITAALADGRLLPAQQQWAENLGKSNPEALSEYLASAQPIAALTQSQTGGKAPSEQTAALSLEQKHAAKMLGMSEDEYQQSIKE